MEKGKECSEAETGAEWGKREITLKGETRVHELIGTKSKTFLSMLYRKGETRTE